MKTILTKLSLARSTRDPSRPRTRGGFFQSLTSFAVSAGLLVGGNLHATTPSGPVTRVVVDGKTIVSAVTPLSFGTVGQNSSGSSANNRGKTLNIVNVGSDPSTLNSIILPKQTKSVFLVGDKYGDFVVSPSNPSYSLALGSSASITVTFAPQAVAGALPTRSATLHITTNSVVSPDYTIALQGVAGSPVLPTIAVQNSTGVVQSAVNFGNAVYSAIDPDTITQTLTVKNLGNTTNLTIDLADITITGANASDFAVDTSSFEAGSPISIPAGSSISLPVSVTPSGLNNRTATLHIHSNATNADTHGNDGHGNTTISLTAKGIPPASFTFGAATYSVLQGVPVATVNILRSSATIAQNITVTTANGTSNAYPPYSAALAGTDYVKLATGSPPVDGVVASFPINVLTKSVTIPLIKKTGDQPNRRFTVSISAPDHSGTIGTISTATVNILGLDVTKPVITVDTPATSLKTAAAVSGATYTVSGTASDAKGIAKVVVTVNGVVHNADLDNANGAGTAVPFSLNYTPILGINTISVTAYDLRGNASLTTVRSFTLTGGVKLTIARTVPNVVATKPNVAGNVSVASVNISDTWMTKAVSNAPITNPQQYLSVDGTQIRLVATANVGYAFSSWSGLPDGATTKGNITTFPMSSDPRTVTAVYVPAPFKGSANTTDTFTGLVPLQTLAPGASSAPDGVYTEGFLTGVISESTGVFTGNLKIDGASTNFVATFFGNGTCTFNTSGGTDNTLSVGSDGRTLTMNLDVAGTHDTIDVTTTAGDGTISHGTITRGYYSSTRKVASGLLNKTSGGTSTGFFTFKLPAVALLSQAGQVTSAADYAQGTGYGTITLNSSGGFSFSGTLADGTSFTSTSTLTSATDGPVFAQLTTLGASTKLGVLAGTLHFAVGDNTDVSDTTHLMWFRPANVGAFSVPQPYADGWPKGIYLDMAGALFNDSQTTQTTLGALALDATHGNSLLTFTDGQLTGPVVTDTVTNAGINIVNNTVSFTRTSLAGISMTLDATTHSTFTGSFTPTWTTPANFKGVILQKGTNAGGVGFFLSTRTGEGAPESGKVVLSKNE